MLTTRKNLRISETDPTDEVVFEENGEVWSIVQARLHSRTKEGLMWETTEKLV